MSTAFCAGALVLKKEVRPSRRKFSGYFRKHRVDPFQPSPDKNTIGFRPMKNDLQHSVSTGNTPPMGENSPTKNANR
jgi:hypothetical protein